MPARAQRITAATAVNSSCSGTTNLFWAAAPNPIIPVYAPTNIGAWSDKGRIVPVRFQGPPDLHITPPPISGCLQCGNEFTTDPRQQTLWVVILLTDGQPTRASVAPYRPITPGPTTSSNTWTQLPYCNDLGISGADPTTDANPPYAPQTPARFIRSDYAYDMADYVGKKYPIGQDALIYTIGWGEVRDTSNRVRRSLQLPAGQTNEGLGTIFLNYAARRRGQAFYAPPGQTWKDLYADRTNIATRLSQ